MRPRRRRRVFIRCADRPGALADAQARPPYRFALRQGDRQQTVDIPVKRCLTQPAQKIDQALSGMQESPRLLRQLGPGRDVCRDQRFDQG